MCPMWASVWALAEVAALIWMKGDDVPLDGVVKAAGALKTVIADDK